MAEMIPDRYRHMFEALCAGLAEFRAVRLSGEGATGSPAGEGIKISTIHSPKGLQFGAVILMWADLLPSDFEDCDEDSEHKLLYIGLPRNSPAMKQLRRPLCTGRPIRDP